MNLKSKKPNRILLKRMSLLLTLVLFFTVPYAQPATGGLDNEVDSTSGGSVPIDGGLSLVLAAGLGYGAKKIRDYNKKKREEEELDRVEL